MKTVATFLIVLSPLAALTLTTGGKSDYSICVAADAPPPDQRAAAELQTFVQQMSGARLAIDSACKSKQLLYVGDSPALKKAARDLNFSSFGPEEYILKSLGRNLILAGGAPRGTLYSVYAFLDRLGCRWFTASVSRIPRRPTIDIPPLDLRERPAFEYREPFFTEAFDKDWAARNRTNGANQHLDASTGGKLEYFPFVHSFEALVPPKKYFQEHPEYFSLIDGARRAERSQLCLTNPDVLRIAVAQVREWIREHPTAKIISVSQNDWEGWCECDRCRRVEHEEGDRHSGPLLRFVNAVAAEIGKTNPDKLIDTLAYWYTEDPPSTVRPLPNVRIRLCPIGVCEAHPYTTCPRSTYFAKNLAAWSRITDRLYIWHYNTNFSHYVSPFPDFDELAANIPLYRRSGVVGLFMEGGTPAGGGVESAELRSYVMARQLWNPAVDVSREMDDFLQGVYGPAAKPMRQYLDRMHREVRVPPAGEGRHIWIFNLPDFSDAFIKDARVLLRQAYEASPDPAIRRRVEHATLPLDYLELVRSGVYRLDGNVYTPPDLDGFQTRFHAFAEHLKTFGIDSIREGRPLEQDEKTVSEMEAFEVLPLKNDRWQVSLVPSLAGRMVEMKTLPGGENLIRRIRAGEGYNPNLGGQVVQVYPDFPLKAWDIAWTTNITRENELLLLGETKNGLQLTRRVRLAGEWVQTEVTVQNASAEPIELVVQSRADLEPGDIDKARIRFRTAGGAAMDNLILTPGTQPSGSETRKGADLPAGEWTLERQGLPQIVNQFSPELTERVTLSWTAKGGPRVTLGVWSKKQTLKPGETLKLESNYR